MSGESTLAQARNDPLGRAAQAVYRVADGDAANDPHAADGAVPDAQEPAWHLIQIRRDRNPHAEADRRHQSPPSPDDQSEDEPNRDEHGHDHSPCVGISRQLLKIGLPRSRFGSSDIPERWRSRDYGWIGSAFQSGRW
jgi:hypothetical protein